MKPEDVPIEIVEAALAAKDRAYAAGDTPMQAALAAAWPLIAKAERKRCIEILDDLSDKQDGNTDWSFQDGWREALDEVDAQIRALGEPHA